MNQLLYHNLALRPDRPQSARLHRRIADDEDFILATHPSPRSGQALVQPGKGIKLNYLYYGSDAFRHPEVERTKVSVRYDPFDVGVAYAYVQGEAARPIGLD